MSVLTTLDEEPVFVPSGSEELFGVWHRGQRRAMSDAESSTAVAVTMVAGAGHLTCSHRNRMYVRLARRLAADGFDVLRIDYHGVGLSTGAVERFSLDQPFTADVAAAVRFLGERGFTRHALVGSCFGARTVLSCAGEIEGIEAMALVSPPLQDFEQGEETAIEWGTRRLARRVLDPSTLKGFLDADRRKVYWRFATTKLRAASARARGALGMTVTDDRGCSPDVLRSLDVVTAREMPLLFLYGTDDNLWQHFEQARQGTVGKLLQRDENVTVETYDGPLHGFDNLGAQDIVVDVLPRWLADVTRPRP